MRDSQLEPIIVKVISEKEKNILRFCARQLIHLNMGQC